jgi:hypothetical protein
MLEILGLILKFNTKSNCNGPEPVKPVWQTGQTGFASQFNHHFFKTPSAPDAGISS